jgi:LysM repeat protein
MAFPAPGLTAEGGLAAPGPSVTVQPGDSWASVRNRLFPLDALQKANPHLNPELLHPGEVVRAPYAPLPELQRARAARDATERQLADLKARIAEFEKDRASFETRRRELSRAEAALPALRAVVIGLILLAIALLVQLAVLVRAVRTERRKAREAVSRASELQSRYDGLRASLHELDLGLQRRVLSLLQLHGGRIVSNAEVEASITPMIERARELKKKHKSA